MFCQNVNMWGILKKKFYVVSCNKIFFYNKILLYCGRLRVFGVKGKGKPKKKGLTAPERGWEMSGAGVPDFFYREAQRLGYVARSAFKVNLHSYPPLFLLT